MKKDYSRNVSLRCVICGDAHSFTISNDESYIKCEKCGKEYHGGKDELIALNQQLIDEEIEEITAEVQKDVQDDINKMIKSIFK